ncbi:sulfatase-like hydrolase/transferase [Pelagicoccus enzymogenes]|uniref:sulfatase family protein n=1 Tax=Pelagicoccus enzymogenes TaxID=2773457 RepID=UPI0028107691|nr:sulfatase-like hydrolase/transferase [Pelagicoccus enzymogenes]MDQ8197861.1 sulfatase-like hydrolase/transferase [Pelagicoccus enzymogenes]
MIRIACFLLAGLSLVTGVGAAADRPNIVVVLCDDLGYGDLANYGHPYIKTPYLDRMAKEGIRFTDFYSAAPVCSPSRVGMMTGRSPNRAGVYDWIPPGTQRREDRRDLVHMRASEVTIPQLLKQAGYATAMAGKWHCNSMFNTPEQPQPGDAGFDHWLATHNNASPSHANPVNYVRNGEAVGEIEGYSCQIVVDEGIRWIDGLRKYSAGQPFFLYLAFHEPHEPVASPEELTASYRDVAFSEKEAEYFANVENVDRAVGRLLAYLKESGVDEDTLVIFTSDNGPETLNRYERSSRSWGRADPLRGMKLWTTDAGFRVAGIMRWPRQIESGQVSDEVVSALDFLPTFCELADAEVPAGLELDGANFLPALEGEAIQREKPLVWAFYNALNEQQLAMRDGDWKVLGRLGLARTSNVGAHNIDEIAAAPLVDVEIYNLRYDIGEARNIAGSHPELAERLTQKLKEQYAALLEGSHVWE